MDLEGRRVLVTGASRGIGAATVRRFHDAGAIVALAARSAAPIEALADELGGRAYAVDLADAGQVEGFIERVEADGPIDVLVNNAGVEAVGLLTDMAGPDVDHLVALNVATPFKLAGQVIPGMLDRGVGHIVQVSSIAGLAPMPAMVAYTASKAALTHGTASLELELRGTGVGCTTVQIGIVETDMGRSVADAPELAGYFARLARFGSPPEIAADTVAAEIVQAVRRGRRFVTLPRSALALAGIDNVPRRLTATMLRGLTFR